MLSLNLPAFDAKIAVRDGKRMIFDAIRRRYVALTPEEWVRQHFVHFLITHKGYPQTLMANEVQVQLNGTRKRCDTVLYRRDLSARILESKGQTRLKVNVYDRNAQVSLSLFSKSHKVSLSQPLVGYLEENEIKYSIA